MSIASLDRFALLVIDVQRAFDDDPAHWGGGRNNPDCEANISALIDRWRAAKRAVVFVRHDSVTPGSPLRPGLSGNAFKDLVRGEPDLLVVKHVNSAFIGKPDLAAWLRERRLEGIVVTGITTNHCCETTARMGANLGFHVLFALDATHTFDRKALDGGIIRAEDLARVTAANLNEEFAQVVKTSDLLK
jgi:nicotinamidase-related amidase